ncbi:PD-(D/E)XK nuclease-like domain-containing protein [Actinomycetaceae bacterium MB13-C1-2]|nr:PD-(D/E)XK nuclease-like domain-containing protein [Actinomycetaceae bacterium MB13-C1-2]
MSDLITEPCVIEGMDEAQYHADPVKGGSLSYSGMKQLLKSPAHYRHYMDQPRAEKKVFDAGHIIHALVLGTGLDVAVIPEHMLASNGATSTKAAKDFIADARLDGMVPVKESELAPLKAVAEAALTHPAARTLFESDSPAELSMFAPDPETGVWLRGRADKISELDGETVIVDLKTTTDADPKEFNRKDVAKFGYYIQAVVYPRLWQLTHEDTPMPGMLFVAVSKTEPYLVSVNSLDWMYDDLGTKAMREAIRRYQDGVLTGDWPGYTEQVTELTPPSYLVYEDDEEIEID